MKIAEMPGLASRFGVNAASSSDDIKNAMSGPLSFLAKPVYGVDLASINTFIDGSFKGNAKEAFAFMDYAAKTELGHYDLDKLIKNGWANKLADQWQHEPDHKTFLAQYPIPGASNTAVALNASPSPNPATENAPTPAAPTSLAASTGTPSAANPGNSSPTMNSSLGDQLTKLMTGITSILAQVDPNGEISRSLLKVAGDALQASLQGAGQGYYGALKTGIDDGAVIVRALTPPVPSRSATPYSGPA